MMIVNVNPAATLLECSDKAMTLKRESDTNGMSAMKMSLGGSGMLAIVRSSPESFAPFGDINARVLRN